MAHTELDVDVLAVLQRLELTGLVISDEFVSKCVFHGEKGNPNLEINIKTGLWHCWVCGVKGNLPQLIMRIRSLSYAESVDLLIDYSTYPDIGQIRERNLHELETILHPPQVKDFVEVDVRPYLYHRDWWVEHCGFDTRFAKRYFLGFDVDNRRAIVAVSFMGKWVGIIQRATRSWQYPRYLYNKDFEREHILYAWDYLPDGASSAIIVEGSRDALRLHSYGYRHTLAALGTSITATQQYLLSTRFDEVTIFADNDPAGHIASLNWAKQLSESISRVFVVRYTTHKKDPNLLSSKQVKSMLQNRVHWTVLLNEFYDT